ncbi:MAG TPA: hypothetical protein VI603_14670 [Saprospiraceae bacterium]|nr:hypothetical protein [Saprospiraceae bacterium]
MIPKRKKKPPIHEELEGFDINVNSLGELESTLDIDKINEFLNKNLEDKKLPDEDVFEEDAEGEEEDDVLEKDLMEYEKFEGDEDVKEE